MHEPAPAPMLSVVVKCLNEEANLARCLRSLVDHAAPFGAEIIVADAGSSDRSAEIAAAFPVRVLRLADPAERCCGATAHLGWQSARGSHLLLIDGDMELMPDFLPRAFAALRADRGLAAVGGGLIEMSDGLEFQERLRRPNPDARPGEVEKLTGCALYRGAALRDVGHFMDRNLHSFEELELALRLRAAGWRLARLDLPSVRHHGHRGAALPLLGRRWRTRYFHGYGELLRAAWGRPHFGVALRAARVPLLVVGWWATLAALALASLASPVWGLLLAAAALLPAAALLLRKRSLHRAAYGLALWQVMAAGLVAGLLRPRVAPSRPLRAELLHDGTRQHAERAA